MAYGSGSICLVEHDGRLGLSARDRASLRRFIWLSALGSVTAPYGSADRFDSQNARIIRMMRARLHEWCAGSGPGDAQGVERDLRGGHASDGSSRWPARSPTRAPRWPRKARCRRRRPTARPSGSIRPRRGCTGRLGLLLSEQGRLPEAASELQTAKRLSFRETEARAIQPGLRAARASARRRRSSSCATCSASIGGPLGRTSGSA